MSEESWNILSSTNPEIERNIYDSILLELNALFPRFLSDVMCFLLKTKITQELRKSAI